MAGVSEGDPYLAGFGDCTSLSPTAACGAAAAAFLPLPFGLALLHNGASKAVSNCAVQLASGETLAMQQQFSSEIVLWCATHLQGESLSTGGVHSGV